MNAFVATLLVLAVSVACGYAEENDVNANDLSHGFGDDIKWTAWNDALTEAKSASKPVFLLIHKTWCGACQALKTTFRVSTKRDEFVELTKEFIMVNTEDDEEPEDEKYAPDGGYIPRIFFLDTQGELIKGTDNAKEYPRNKHYFAQIPSLIKAMKKALDTMKEPSEEEVDTKEKTAKETDKKKPKDASIKKDKKVAEEEEDEFSGCPHAAKARAAKKQKEAEQKMKEDKKKEAEKKQAKTESAKEKSEDAEGKKEGKKEEKKKEKKTASKPKDGKTGAEGKAKNQKKAKGDSGDKTEL